MFPAAVAIGAALAVYLETRLWLVATFPYSLDEGIIASFAQEGLDPNQRLASLGEGIRPGLGWLTMFGMQVQYHLAPPKNDPAGDPLLSIRLVAVTFGLLALISGAIVAYRYVSRVAAAAFVVLALVTPYLVLYNSFGFRDSVIAGLMIAGFLLELELARRPRLSIGLLLGVTFALDILVKDSGKTAVYLLPLCLLYFPFRSPQRLRLAGAWILNVGLALAMMLLATVPMRLTILYKQLGSTQDAYHVLRSYSDILHHPIVYFNQSWPGVRDDLTLYVTYPILALALFGLVTGLRRRPRFTALVAVWAFGQVGASIWVAANVYARYSVPRSRSSSCWRRSESTRPSGLDGSSSASVGRSRSQASSQAWRCCCRRSRSTPTPRMRPAPRRTRRTTRSRSSPATARVSASSQRSKSSSGSLAPRAHR